MKLYDSLARNRCGARESGEGAPWFEQGLKQRWADEESTLFELVRGANSVKELG